MRITNKERTVDKIFPLIKGKRVKFTTRITRMGTAEYFTGSYIIFKDVEVVDFPEDEPRPEAKIHVQWIRKIEFL